MNIDEKLEKIFEEAFRSKARARELAQEEERKGYFNFACHNYLEAGMGDKSLEMARKFEEALELNTKERQMNRAQLYASIGAREDFVRLTEKYQFTPEEIKVICHEARIIMPDCRLFHIGERVIEDGLGEGLRSE